VVEDMRAETVNAIVGDACPPNSYPEQWNIEGMKAALLETLNIEAPIEDWLKEEAIDPELVETRVREIADAAITQKASELEPETWIQVEKSILLQNLDHHWKEHLATLDALRQVVHLRAYAQKTPINEYKQEAFALFQRMLEAIRVDVTRTIAYARFQIEPPPALPDLPSFITQHFDPFTGDDDSADIDGGSLGLVTTRLPQLSIPRPDGSNFGSSPEGCGGVTNAYVSARDSPSSGPSGHLLPQGRRKIISLRHHDRWPDVSDHFPGIERADIVPRLRPAADDDLRTRFIFVDRLDIDVTIPEGVTEERVPTAPAIAVPVIAPARSPITAPAAITAAETRPKAARRGVAA
jgi:hypothetical protein